jgi:PAS domain S-box-containing protein
MSTAVLPGSPGDVEVRQLRTLYQLLAALTQAKDLEEVYDAAISSLLKATAADRAAILMFDQDGVNRFHAWRGLSSEYRQAVTGHSPWPKGAMNAGSIVVPNVFLEDSLSQFHEILRREQIGAAVLIPLALANGVFGKFMLYYPEPHECEGDELAMAQAIASHVSIAVDRKRSELACIESEKRLQAILDNSATVIFMKDPQGRYLLANRRYEEVFGVSRAELVGRTDFDVFAPEMAEIYRANDRKVIETGEPLAVEESAPHADGLHTYISIKFPFDGPDGKPAGVAGISTDITERKHLELVSERLAAIVESSDDAIIAKDLNGIIQSWNKGAERIFGYTAEEVIGQPISMLAVPDRRNEMPELLGQIRRGLRVDHYETLRRTKDGRTIPVSLTVSPVRDASGEIVGASKIARDITLRRDFEEREKDARRTAELLNRVGPQLLTELDQEKLVESVTDIATSLVGAEFGAFFHNVVNEQGESYTLYTLSGVPREAFSSFPMPRSTGLFGPTFRGEGVLRCDDVTKDSRYGQNPPQHGMPQGHLPVRSYLAAPVVSRSGEVLGGLFFGHSAAGKFTGSHEAIVTGIAAQAAIAMDNARLFERAQWAQTELRRSNEELRRANQDLETFAYSASHDLQEPLRNIAISAQLLERSSGHQLQGDQANFLKTILTGANRMTGLLQDLLAYTQATRFAEGSPPTADPGAVLAGVLENLAGSIAEAKAKITWDDLPALDIHESRLAQLFQNLVSNALKYRGQEAPRIHVSANERDGWCTFSVSDNGIGMEMRYAGQIFGLFKRLHNRDRYLGSGIGLAICQRVVEQYGGRIWLEKSAPGEGSTFCFAIPTRAR